MTHYKVVSGDTLSKIAAAHQTTAKVLLAANPYCVSKPGDAKTLRVGVVIHVDDPVMVPPDPEPEPEPPSHPGMLVSDIELTRWRKRAKGEDTRNFHSKGDEFTNSPGDWDRIIVNKNTFMANPGNYAWPGMTAGYPTAVISSSSWTDSPPDKSMLGAPEFARDAAFYALASDDPARDDILVTVKTQLLATVRSKYNDFSDSQRFNPANQGTGFEPIYLLGLYLGKTITAFDYSQAANPGIWTTAEKAEFINWLWSVKPWFEGKLDQRLAGHVDYQTGIATVSGKAAWPGGLIWNGGPAEPTISHKCDNHVPALSTVLTLTACLAEHHGVALADLDGGKSWTRLLVKSYLHNEVLPQAVGNSGGQGSGPRFGAGQFYRGVGSTSEDGWKYSVEWLGRLLIGVEALKRAGEDWYGYDADDTQPDVLGDSYYSNPGPVTLHRAAQQLARFVVETGTGSHPWRYAHKTSMAVADRIDSQDEIANILRSNEWELAPFFTDHKLNAIYDRTAAGCPPHPANPRHGRYWVWNGPGGIFPAVCLQYLT